MQEPINNQSMLKVGTILRGTYRIDSYLSSGGFGNTYVATNIEFEERVAIKEFFMKGVTQREDNQTTVSVSNSENTNSFLEQKEKFKKEARRIRQLDNPHIVKVHDLFDENGTAYYVMDYVEGENLAETLKRTGRPMSEQQVLYLLPQILEALKSVHDTGMWHLDLKPANIMVDAHGKIKLIDFGASKQLNAQKGGATTSTAISYTNGYAPREQMEQNYDKFGPWTDIYALGATLYNLLTNKRPPLPTDIDDDESEDKHVALPFPENVGGIRFLVLLMMKTNRMQRPQSIDAVIDAEQSRKVEPQLASKQKKTETTSTSYDDEATIIVEPKTKMRDKKTANVSDSMVNDDGKGKGKKTLDSIAHQIPFRVISIISVLFCIGLIIIISPLLISTFGDYVQTEKDYVLCGIKEQNIEALSYISKCFVYLIKAGILWAIHKGLRNLGLFIPILLKAQIVICILYAFYNFTPTIFFDLIAFFEFYLLLLLFISSFPLGFYLRTYYIGNISKLGFILVLYSIIAFLLLFLGGSSFALFFYAEFLWIYGMWWMLTRKQAS